MYVSKVKQFIADVSGATTVEYAVGAAFIVSAIVGLVGAVGTTIKAESHATVLNGKVMLASSKKDLVRIAARSSSDPIQTGSTADATEGVADVAPRLRNLKDLAHEANAISLCNAGDQVRPCRLDTTKQSFQGWRGTLVEWSSDEEERDH